MAKPGTAGSAQPTPQGLSQTTRVGANQLSKWFPTKQQLSDPVQLERSFRQVLEQQYAIQARLDDLVAAGAADPPGDPPAGSGPADTMILGLRVAPIDTTSLADGATLKYSKANGNFQFS